MSAVDRLVSLAGRVISRRGWQARMRTLHVASSGVGENGTRRPTPRRKNFRGGRAGETAGGEDGWKRPDTRGREQDCEGRESHERCPANERVDRSRTKLCNGRMRVAERHRFERNRRRMTCKWRRIEREDDGRATARPAVPVAHVCRRNNAARRFAGAKPQGRRVKVGHVFSVGDVQT